MRSKWWTLKFIRFHVVFAHSRMNELTIVRESFSFSRILQTTHVNENTLLKIASQIRWSNVCFLEQQDKIILKVLKLSVPSLLITSHIIDNPLESIEKAIDRSNVGFMLNYVRLAGRVAYGFGLVFYVYHVAQTCNLPLKFEFNEVQILFIFVYIAVDAQCEKLFSVSSGRWWKSEEETLMRLRMICT